MIARTFQITLDQPVLAPALEGDPNSAVTLPYVPGSMIRGALLGRYMRANRIGACALDAGDPAIRRLFFDAATRFLNAYPRGYGGRRAHPTPLSWHIVKGDDHTVYDLAVAPEPRDDSPQWEGTRSPFCSSRQEDSPGFVQPDRVLAVHMTRDRVHGRPMPAVGGETRGAVYRYEAIAPGTVLHAAILFDTPDDAAIFEPLLDGTLYLGGSRTAGYGRVRIQRTLEQDDGWQERGQTALESYGDRLIALLLSDAVIWNQEGSSTAAARDLASLIARELGISVPQPLEAYVRSTAVGGFNRKWGLPLPQVAAVKMGSVVVLDWPHPAPADWIECLRRVEEEGIGERREDGFGRVAFNLFTEGSWQPETLDSHAEPGTAALSDSSRNLAAQMAGRLLADRMEAILLREAANLGRQIRGPSLSQISRLRRLLGSLASMKPADVRKRLGNYLDDLEARQTARLQFKDDRLEGKPLLRWIQDRAADTQAIWHETDSGNPIRNVGGVPPDRTDAEAYRLNLRLIDAVLARAAREKRRKEG